jgi:hypothetical protein
MYMTTSEYESYLRTVFRERCPHADAVAIDEFIGCRWPMLASEVPDEARGRGLIVTAEDVSAFIAEQLATADDREYAAELMENIPNVCFTPAAVDLFLEWSVTTERARAIPEYEEQPQRIAAAIRAGNFRSN